MSSEDLISSEHFPVVLKYQGLSWAMGSDHHDEAFGKPSGRSFRHNMKRAFPLASMGLSLWKYVPRYSLRQPMPAYRICIRVTPFDTFVSDPEFPGIVRRGQMC